MNKCLHLGLLLATDVLFVVGLPSVRIWPNNTKTIELGSVQKYYCKVEGVHNFFLTTSPRFFQAKGARRYIQNSTEIEKDTALLTKTFELFDEDTELFCVWKPVKTKSHVFPSALLSERVAIRFSEPVMEESCTCDTWWPWLIAVALVGVVIVIIVVGIVIAFCRRTKAQREQQPLPNIQ
ncbi:uncharacterized protein LOC113239585, partial [Hyposmocoma kahamanoa]|uniref:uncharacterized protein LOC113239585 n=1 Tax=Hyposmocoma kahamanoa TaxID=1477025 RepID=UPI000E6D6DB8